jgi:hypothetical protein
MLVCELEVSYKKKAVETTNQKEKGGKTPPRA